MQYIIVETIGWIGSILILAAYFLNMQHKILATSPFYIWANLIGGACFVINTIYHHAFPSAALNIIWVLIAVFSLARAKK
ncbi:MAG: hypothetical protein KGL19_02170 [Bacteroidota bacterium]|nr:hypothetical protein [Bacteroidota bacterium]